MAELSAKQWVWLKIAAIGLMLPFIYFFFHLKETLLVAGMYSVTRLVSTFSIMTFGLPVGALGTLFLLCKRDARGIKWVKYTAFLSLWWFVVIILPWAILGEGLCSEMGDPTCNPMSVAALLNVLPPVFSLLVARHMLKKSV